MDARKLKGYRIKNKNDTWHGNVENYAKGNKMSSFLLH